MSTSAFRIGGAFVRLRILAVSVGGLAGFIAGVSSAAFAKSCSTGDIVALARQGFSKSEIGKLCDGQGSAKATSPLAELFTSVRTVATSGSQDLGAALFKQGKWTLAPTSPGTSILPYAGDFKGWTIGAEPKRLSLRADLAPQAPETAERCKEIRDALDQALDGAASRLSLQTSPFSDDGNGNVQYGAQVFQGAEANLKIYLSCSSGGKVRTSNGARQQGAAVNFALEIK